MTSNKIDILQTRTEQPIQQTISALQYPQPILDLFRLEDDAWQALYPAEAEKLKSHLRAKTTRDQRTVSEIGKDVVLGWVVEDLTARHLQRHGFAVKRNGCDALRAFSDVRQVVPQADLIISKNGSAHPLEVTACFSDFWMRNGYQSLRQKKLNRMKEQGAILLSLDIYANQSFACLSARLFDLPSPSHCFRKDEVCIFFDHCIQDGQCYLPATWKPIPKAFWEV